MATTTNFGWETPDDTDLVKDGAAAIRTALGGVDTSFVDLKGGTTGQILSKASNTDLDYTWITNDVGDITAVTAGTGITGGGTSGAVTVSFDQANYGGGQYAAGKNKIINGDFRVWQRGTSFTPANSAEVYNADRFLTTRNGTGATVTVSRQAFTAGSAPVSGYEGQYFLRFDQSVAGTGGTFNGLNQKIEDVRTFAGQTVTISFWAKASAGLTLSYLVLNQNFGSGGSATVTNSATAPTLTTSWARYTATISIPSISGKTIGTNSFLDFAFGFPNNAVQTIDIWGVQVEAGSTATPFQTATGTIQGELAACQRYYWRAGGNAVYQAFGNGIATIATSAQVMVSNPVPMRTTPSSHAISTLGLTDTSTTTAITASVIGQAGINQNLFQFTTASGLTQFRPYILNANNSTSAYIEVSAEL